MGEGGARREGVRTGGEGRAVAQERAVGKRLQWHRKEQQEEQCIQASAVVVGGQRTLCSYTT